MIKRPRRTGSLRPGTSELEKHQGISTMLFGGAAAALSPIDQPSFVDVAGSSAAPADQPRNSGDGGQSAGLQPSAPVADSTIPDAVIVPGRVGVEARSSGPEPLAQPATPVSANASDLIRPLTLAPSEESQPQTILQTPPPQSSNWASKTVSAGADSSAASVAVPTPVIMPLPAPPPNIAKGSPQALLGAVSPGPDNSGDPMSLAAGSRKFAHGHHGTARGRTSGASGGIHLGRGHAATGGGTSATVGPKSVGAYGGGGGATGSTFGSTGFGTSSTMDSLPSAYTSAGSETGGTYSAAETMPMPTMPMAAIVRPMGQIGATGKVSVLGAGMDVIGGSANFYASAAAISGTTPTLTNEQWSISGPTPVYSSQTVPNPSATPPPWGFVNTSLNTAAFNGQSSIDFAWGEHWGVNYVTLNADVTLGNKTVPIKPVTERVDVGRPKIDYTLRAQSGVTAYNGAFYWLQYGKKGAISDTGISWTFSTPAGGSLAVVQVINSGSDYTCSSGGDTYSTMVNASFPLLDGASGATNPFYFNQQGNPVSGNDSPNFSLPWLTNSASMVLNMTDYVMYNDGGMWVPAVSFTWHVNGQASYGWLSATVTNVVKAGYTKPTYDSTWPWWRDNAWNYTNWVIT